MIQIMAVVQCRQKVAHATSAETGFQHRSGWDRHHRSQRGCIRLLFSRFGERTLVWTTLPRRIATLAEFFDLSLVFKLHQVYRTPAAPRTPSRLPPSVLPTAN